MTAKNIIGPTSITIFYFALKHGVDLQRFMGWIVVSSSGKAVSGSLARMAFASYLSTLLFPLVVIFSSKLGPLFHYISLSLSRKRLNIRDTVY